jgi:ribonuclease D
VDLAVAAAARQPIDPVLPSHFTPRRRQGVHGTVRTALALPTEKHPKPISRKSRWPGESEKRRFVELNKRRDAAAHRLDIDPTLIASRATLGELANDWDKYAPGLMRWQRELMQA